MHKLLAIAAAIIAVEASAAQVWVNADNARISRPDRIGQTINPTDGQLATHGIRAVAAPDNVDERFWVWDGDGFSALPQAEIDAILAADAQAAVDAEQARIAAKPDLLKQAENGFIGAVMAYNAAYPATAIALDDGFLQISSKIESADMTEIEKLKLGMTLRTLWDLVLFHGGRFGDIQFHPEVEP
jgi:hypothetical protein